MTEANHALLNRPAWVDLSTKDPEGSRAFYAKVFGWDIQVSADPQYGGYAMATLGGKDVAGIGPSQSPEAPTAWSVYIGTADADAVASQGSAAGGTVIAPPFDVGDQGRMAVFQDPTGAFICAWQAKVMGGFEAGAANTFGWAELSARNVAGDLPFYESVFGWTVKTSPMGEGQPPYNEFQLDGESVAGATEMNPMVPPQVPSYWMVYFAVADADATFKKAIDAGGHEVLAPQDFPGGRSAIVSDPQGAVFAIRSITAR